MDKAIKFVTTRSQRDLIQSGKVTHVYGPPKSGKSTLSANIALELVKLGFKVLIVSTERPIEIRMSSMVKAGQMYNMALMEGILTTDIYSFDELMRLITKELLNHLKDIDLLIIDSLTSSYRFKADPITLTLLRKALATLQSIALGEKKAIFFTNQVSSQMDKPTAFRPVASASVRSYSDITIRLTKTLIGQTEISFEDLSGNEIEVLEPTNISASGFEDFHQLFEIIV